MEQMINGYKQSCLMAKNRILELTQQRNELRKQGENEKIEELDLERRIRLLYSEHSQMQEIILHLTAYMRRVEQRAKT